MNTLSVIAVIVLAGLVGLRIAMPRLGSPAAGGVIENDGQRALIDCGSSPNCQGSFSTREAQRVAPFNLHESSEKSLDELSRLLETQPGTKIESRTENYLHATFTTRLMGYVDDVEFLVDEDSATIGVRSASRVGKSDLGANAKRIEALRQAWQANE